VFFFFAVAVSSLIGFYVYAFSILSLLLAFFSVLLRVLIFNLFSEIKETFNIEANKSLVKDIERTSGLALFFSLLAYASPYVELGGWERKIGFAFLISSVFSIFILLLVYLKVLKLFKDAKREQG